MGAREKLGLLKEKFGAGIRRADLPGEQRLFVFTAPDVVKDVLLRHQTLRNRDAMHQPT